MHIDLSGQETEILGRQAAAAGFANANEYVAQFVHTLAQNPDPLLASLSNDELATSLSMIDQGVAEIRAGKGLSVEEARRASLAHLDVNVQ
jgi:hypothetical protein